MKITKILLACAGIMAMGTGMTSCLGGNNSDIEYTQTMSGYFNVAFSSPDDEPTYYNGVGYQVVYNATQMTADVVIDGLQLWGTTYSQMQFSDETWSLTDYWKTIKLSSVQPTSLTTAPVFDSFVMRIYDRYVLSTVYAPLTQIQYNVMGLTVNSMPSGVICVGTTTVTLDDGHSFSTDMTSETYPTYGLQFYSDTSTNLNNASERKGVLEIANFSFTGNNSTTNLVIKNISFDIDYSGTATLSIDAEEPLQEATSTSSTTTTAYGDYVVTEFTGTADAMNNMWLRFKVSSETEDKAYTIVVSCQTPTSY